MVVLDPGPVHLGGRSRIPGSPCLPHCFACACASIGDHCIIVSPLPLLLFLPRSSPLSGLSALSFLFSVLFLPLPLRRDLQGRCILRGWGWGSPPVPRACVPGIGCGALELRRMPGSNAVCSLMCSFPPPFGHFRLCSCISSSCRPLSFSLSLCPVFPPPSRFPLFFFFFSSSSSTPPHDCRAGICLSSEAH